MPTFPIKNYIQQTNSGLAPGTFQRSNNLTQHAAYSPPRSRIYNSSRLSIASYPAPSPKQSGPFADIVSSIAWISGFSLHICIANAFSRSRLMRNSWARETWGGWRVLLREGGVEVEVAMDATLTSSASS